LTAVVDFKKIYFALSSFFLCEEWPPFQLYHHFRLTLRHFRKRFSFVSTL